MTIEYKLDADILKINVSGRFVFGLHMHFRDAIDNISRYRVKQIIIDLAKTDYIDSAALGMLLILRDKFTGRNTIQIKNARNDVKKILEVAHFDTMFALV